MNNNILIGIAAVLLVLAIFVYTVPMGSPTAEEKTYELDEEESAGESVETNSKATTEVKVVKLDNEAETKVEVE